jgi:ribonuclease HII
VLKYETELLSKGYTIICGLDEVGVGPLAGDIVACAVVLDLDKASKIEVTHKRSKFTINDSKQLTKVARDLLVPLIKEATEAYAFGITTVSEINSQKNIILSAKLSRQRAIENLSKKVHLDAILVDFFKETYTLSDGRTLSGEGIVKGDSKSLSIAAASILAKTYSDDLMSLIHTKYPQYGFDTNAGYGTPKHLEVIKQLGVTPLHRYYYNDKQAVLHS